ncbi:MAG: heavy-metal-associated domain-containing protein [Deltaproteobacteria bacterium]|nr:heavy-metal-associated domain-containing protein [Deltaproteobacteria bacterium]
MTFKSFLIRHACCRWIGLALVAVVPALLAAPYGAWSAGPQPGAAKQAVVAVDGMSCPFCAYGVKKHLSALPGVKSVQVELAKGEAIVEFDPEGQVTDEQIRKAVREAGFTPGKIEWR